MSKVGLAAFFLMMFGCRQTIRAQDLVVKSHSTAASAFKEYHSITEQLIGLLASGEAKPHLCPIGQENYNCFTITDHKLLLPPYPLAPDPPSQGFDIAWVPIRQVKGGQEYYER